MRKKTPEELYQESKKKKGYKGIYQLGIKRAVDIVACLMALPFLMIILIPVAIAIKIEDQGPVFYHSSRLGVGFKEFGMLKFRSMKVNAPDLRNDDGSTFNSDKDPRVTKVGHFLRETSIDEIPQIFNILKGDMSFVGPRPERPEFIVKAVEDIPEFVLRTKVKAGLTGYAQVMGNYSTSFLDKLKWDLMYIENYSLFLDFKILLMTAIAIFAKDNHEDFSKWDML